MERLLHGKAWVVFNFKDGTKETVYTSLSNDVLRSDGAAPREGYLWDFNKKRYAPFRHDAVSVDIFPEAPKFDREVLRFASRFI